MNADPGSPRNDGKSAVSWMPVSTCSCTISRIANSRVSTPSEPRSTIGYSPPAASGGIATSSVTEPGLSGVAVTDWTTKPPPRSVVVHPSGSDGTSRSTDSVTLALTETSNFTVEPGWVAMEGYGVEIVSPASASAGAPGCREQGDEGERGTETTRGAAAWGEHASTSVGRFISSACAGRDPTRAE